MKKYLFIAALAGLTLVGCTSDDFVGDAPDTQSNPTGAINFGGGFRAVTRAGNHVGADAADLLGGKFIVSGFKGASTQATTTVFQDYLVEWADNTAGTTESNTCDWEYVGKTSPVSGATLGAQTIKYWDFSQALYDFIAYAPGKNNSVITTGDPGDNQVLVSAIDAGNVTTAAYTIKGNEAALTKSYIADRVTVLKANYKEDVVLNFRSLAAKVRVGIYETVPGYSVKDVKFYTEDLGTKAQITTGASATSATLIGTFNTGGQYTVSFKAGDQKAYVALNNTGYTAATYRQFGALTYGAKERNEAGSAYLKRAANEPSYANGGEYTTVLPIGENTPSTFELYVDYTLEAIDGTGETITVKGAKAFVPATYTQWLPNYAYTYIFKISDNTNGWTNPDDFDNTDLAGLYPITFDAVVTDSEENTQSTITTVATPSITAYQNGRSLSANEFATAQGDIFVTVMNGSPAAPVTDLNTKGQLYSIGAATTEAMVMDALNIVASTASGGDVITGRNGVVLTKVSTTFPTTVPRKDGNNFTVTANSTAQFTPSAGTYYAYVYTVSTGTPSSVYTAVQLTGSEPADFTTKYYVKQSDNTFRAATSADFVDGGYFYTTYTNSNNVYGVKVIKVE